MHGWREGGGEGCGKSRRLVRHMWPVTRVEAAAPPPAQGQASPPPRSSVPPPLTTSYPPAPTTPPAAAHKKERVDSPRPASSDSFLKVPPLMGFALMFTKLDEIYMKLSMLL
jgi:hypothetical protein